MFVHIWNEELIYQKSIEAAKEHCRQLRAECDIEREMVFTVTISSPLGGTNYLQKTVCFKISDRAKMLLQFVLGNQESDPLVKENLNETFLYHMILV